MSGPVLGFFFFLILSIASPAAAQQQTGESAFQSAVELQPGDVLRITVWRQPDLSGEVPVADDGYLVHPLYRDVLATGAPMPVVEQRVLEVITRYETNPSFVVQPLLQVAVGGRVQSPSLYRLPPSTTIGQAIALAGGPTDRGRLDRIRLIRNGRAYSIDLTRFDQSPGDYPVRSGDEILVGGRGEPFIRSVLIPLFTLVAAAASIVNIFL